MIFKLFNMKEKISLVVAIIGLSGFSCNSGDDSITAPATPDTSKPNAVTAVIEDRSPAIAGGEDGNSPMTAGGEDDAFAGEAASIRAMQSELRNAAVAEESYYAENGAYTIELAALAQMGFEPSPGSNFVIVNGDMNSYCLETGNSNSVYYFDSTEGEPRTGSCP